MTQTVYCCFVFLVVVAATSAQSDSEPAPKPSQNWTIEVQASREFSSRCQIEVELIFEDGVVATEVILAKTRTSIAMDGLVNAPSRATIRIVSDSGNVDDARPAIRARIERPRPGRQSCQLRHMKEMTVTDPTENWWVSDASKAIVHNSGERGHVLDYGGFRPISVQANGHCEMQDQLFGANFTRIYLHGETFEIGCKARCTCMNKVVSCVDMCPPVFRQPEPGEVCRDVYKYGQCCPKRECQQQNEVLACDEGIPLIGSAKLPNNRRISQAMQFDVNVCPDGSTKSCFATGCPLVLISERWLLGASQCVSSLVSETGIDMASANVLASMASNGRRVAVMTIGQVHNLPDSELVLIQLDRSVILNDETLPVNLPTTASQCRRLAQDGCSVTFTQSINPPSYSRRVEISTVQCDVASSAALPTEQSDAITTTALPDRVRRQEDVEEADGHMWVRVKSDEAEPCLGQGHQRNLGQAGTGIIAQAADSQFLIAVLASSGNDKQCLTEGCYRAHSVCNSLVWIKTVAGLAF